MCERAQEWQLSGGTLEIPDGWYVYRVDLDADEPYAILVEQGAYGDDATERKIFIPKALAYYLTVHWCGSQKMYKDIKEQGRIEIRQQIKSALAIEEPPHE